MLIFSAFWHVQSNTYSRRCFSAIYRMRKECHGSETDVVVAESEGLNGFLSGG